MNGRRNLVLGLLVVGALTGCGRFFEEDEKGNKKLRQDAAQELKQTGRELKQAGRELREAGRELQAAGKQASEGAKKVGKALEPVAKELLGDAGITARVKAKLLADPEVKGTAIDVDTVEGKVTLRGKVANRELKAEAEKLARRTDGVVSVTNRLEIGGGSR